jgi:hypothetical protein
MTTSSYVIYLLIKSSAHLAGTSINIKSSAYKMQFEVFWASLEFKGKQIWFALIFARKRRYYNKPLNI